MNRDLKIDLGAVEETLVLPLWARAKDAEKRDPIVNDTFARDIVGSGFSPCFRRAPSNCPG